MRPTVEPVRSGLYGLLRAGRPADLTETVEPGNQVLSAARRHLVRLYSLSLGLGLALELRSEANHGQGKQSHFSNCQTFLIHWSGS